MAVSAYFQSTNRGTVGQLRDGSKIGIIRADNTGATTAFGWDCRVRYYKNLLILEIIQYSAGTTVLPNQEAYSVRGREFMSFSQEFQVAFGGPGIAKFATQSQLASIGLVDGNSIPVQPSNDEIPYELDANLQILKADLPLSDTEFVNQIAQSNLNTALVAGSTGAAAPAAAATTGNFMGMNIDFNQIIKIGLVIAVLVVAYKVAQSQDWI